MRTVRTLLAKTLRATAVLVRDRRIPRPLRWLAAFAVLPIPGPVDEAVLFLIAPLLWIFHRDEMRDAWRQADR
jgi:hypothetical protein